MLLYVTPSSRMVSSPLQPPCPTPSSNPKTKTCQVRSHMLCGAIVQPPRRVHQLLFCLLSAPLYVLFSQFSCHNFNSCLWACPPRQVVNVRKGPCLLTNQGTELGNHFGYQQHAGEWNARPHFASWNNHHLPIVNKAFLATPIRV